MDTATGLRAHGLRPGNLPAPCHRALGSAETSALPAGAGEVASFGTWTGGIYTDTGRQRARRATSLNWSSHGTVLARAGGVIPPCRVPAFAGACRAPAARSQWRKHVRTGSTRRPVNKDGMQDRPPRALKTTRAHGTVTVCSSWLLFRLGGPVMREVWDH
jgi:hypothetical protein